MSGRQVALLRGINVGRAKRVAMADLRSLVVKLGYSDVSTLLNSGNLVFSAPGATTKQTAPRIEAALTSELGVPSRVVSLSRADIDIIVAENKLGDAVTTRNWATLLKLQALMKDRTS